MGTLQLRHIESALDSGFADCIDLSDLADASETIIRQRFLTRALAAYPVVEYTGASATEVALGGTDGTQDNGLDLIHYDPAQQRLYLVQSKWDSTGTAGPKVGDVQKFFQGIRDLTNVRFDRFNEKVRRLEKQITAALDNARISIEAIYVHTGTSEPSDEVRNLFDDLQSQMNDGGDILTARILRQSDIHGMVSGATEGDRIDIDIALFDWGQVAEPYPAYYGQIAATDIASWWSSHGTTLFARNLRKFIHGSDVNDTLMMSVLDAPEHFWYLNNGITVLCQSITRKAIGGADRKHGHFACEGISVVNGAQTVGSIGTALGRKDPNEEHTEARVLVRLISLENCPPDFASLVTRATNTQNRIVSRDFVALDPEQERLRVEMRIEGLTYALKTGDPDPAPEEGCSVVDATVALSCAAPDVQLAVQVKREIGKIWEDTSSAQYKRVFNASTSSTRLWRAVQVMRAVDKGLRKIQTKTYGRRRQIAVHGNRLLLHIVFKHLSPGVLTDAQVLPTEADLTALLDRIFEATVEKVEQDYDGNYLASLFKNTTKCRDVEQSINVDQ